MLASLSWIKIEKKKEHQRDGGKQDLVACKAVSCLIREEDKAFRSCELQTEVEISVLVI